MDGGNDPIVEEVREMELPQEFFDSDGKFINFNAFKTYLSDRWDPNMRTYASDNVYLGIGHNQFTFDFSKSI